MRIGHGYDVHRFAEGRRGVPCGVDIPIEMGPVGHSDADVPLHARMDALLGAAAMGDIGKLFPDTDEKWKGADSMELLKAVYGKITEAGYKLVNCDITVLAQKPKLRPYIDEMRRNIAKALETDIENVSIKATTEEGLGFTGRLEGISAHAVCIIE